MYLLHSKSRICADPLGVVVGITKKKKGNMPRISSNARLGEEAGSYLQLLAGFFAKALVLGGVVYLLTNFSLQRRIVEFLYGTSPILPR